MIWPYMIAGYFMGFGMGCLPSFGAPYSNDLNHRVQGSNSKLLDGLTLFPNEPSLLQLASGETVQLHAILDSKAASHRGQWRSSDSEIVEVDAKGLVVAGKVSGTAEITFEIQEADKTSWQATVEIINQGPSLSVYFLKPDDWNGAYAYAFDSQGNLPFGTWPGQRMNSDIVYGGEWFKSNILTSQSFNQEFGQFVFHSGDGRQTRDLKLGTMAARKVFFNQEGRKSEPTTSVTSFQGPQLQTSGARAYLNLDGDENLSGSLFKPFQMVYISAREPAPGEMFSHFEGSASAWLIDPKSPNTKLMVGPDRSYALFAVFVPIEDPHQEARGLYRKLCASCHGLDGNGASPIANVHESFTAMELENLIQETMPYGSPTLCEEGCAKKITEMILDQAYAAPGGSCQPLGDVSAVDKKEHLERNLRMLTKSEYLDSVADILQLTQMSEVAQSLPGDLKVAGFYTGSNALPTPERVKLFFIASRIIAQKAASLNSFYPECESLGSAANTCKLEKLARRFFRRTLTQAEKEEIAQLYGSNFKAFLIAMLNSPEFLYRSELGTEVKESEGGLYRLTSFELATWLSFAFLGRAPSDALLDLTEKGALDQDEGLLEVATKMLQSPLAKQNFRKFTRGWLKIETRESANTSNALKSAIAEESYRFVEETVFADHGSLIEIFMAKHSFLNGTLAQHYGVDLPRNSSWQKVTYKGALKDRMGILGHAHFFASGATTEATHPVKRGLFVRNQLLCQEFPPPPVGAELKPLQDESATTRERFAILHNKPECQSCHQFIDGIGFGLEGYGPTGLARTHEIVPNGTRRSIDATGSIGSLNSPETVLSAEEAPVPFSGIQELAKLVNESSNSRSCFVRQYFRFSMGRKETPKDQCTLKNAGQRFAEDEQSIVEMMKNFVTLPNFKLRQEVAKKGSGNG